MDEKIFCCHGGLSPDLRNMDQVRENKMIRGSETEGKQNKVEGRKTGDFFS